MSTSPTSLSSLALASLLAVLSACGSKDTGSQPSVSQPFTARGISAAIEVIDPTHPEQPMYHSMGKVPYGQLLIHTFRLRNLESVPITVQRTVPACTCSRVKRIRAIDSDGKEQLGELQKEGQILTVGPGEEFDVEIQLDTARVTPNSGKVAILRVVTDSKIQPFLTFEVHFFAEKWFETASPTLDLGDIPLGGGVGGTLQIYTRPALYNARLLDVVEASPGLQAELTQNDTLGANWNLTVQAEGQNHKGPLRGRIVLSHTDGNGNGNAGRLEIPVEGQVVDQVVLYPPTLSFGVIEHNQGMTLLGSVQGLAAGHRILVTKATIEGASAPFVTVELEPVGADSFGRAVRYDVKLQCAKEAPSGPLEATLRLELADEEIPSIVRLVHGNVL